MIGLCRKKNTDSFGFTLIELLVVISIIGLLSSVVLASLREARIKASISKTSSVLKQIDNVIALYISDNNGYYPCFDGSWEDESEIEWSKPYIKWPRNTLAGTLDPQFHWERSGLTPIFAYSISFIVMDNEVSLKLDEYMDDGDLNTGKIRAIHGLPRIEYGVIDSVADQIILEQNCF